MTMTEENADPILRSLLQTVSWVSEHDEFYRRKWQDAGIDGRTFDEEAFSLLPLTTRDELLAIQSSRGVLDFACRTVSPTECVRLVRSSGSSGKPLWRADDKTSLADLARGSSHAFSLSTVGPRDRVALLARFGKSLGPWVLADGLEAVGALNLSSVPSDEGESLLEWFAALRPTVVVGKPSVLTKLAGEISRPLTSNIRCIICVGAPGGSEPVIRQTLAAHWGCEIFDRYGLTEVGTVAAECEEHPGGLHVLEERVFLEIVDPATGTPLGEGERGEIVITTLGHHPGPLVRYRSGDVGSLIHDPGCACGRVGALLTGGIWRRKTFA